MPKVKVVCSVSRCKGTAEVEELEFFSKFATAKCPVHAKAQGDITWEEFRRDGAAICKEVKEPPPSSESWDLIFRAMREDALLSVTVHEEKPSKLMEIQVGTCISPAKLPLRITPLASDDAKPGAPAARRSSEEVAAHLAIKSKAPMDGCVEAKYFPNNAPLEKILVIMQSHEPCDSCRNAFAGWSHYRRSPIIVGFAKGLKERKAGTYLFLSESYYRIDDHRGFLKPKVEDRNGDAREARLATETKAARADTETKAARADTETKGARADAELKAAMSTGSAPGSGAKPKQERKVS